MIIEVTNLLKALSDKTRLRIINLAYQKEICNCEITQILGVSQPAVTKHIKKLKKAGLLKEKKVGWWSYYSINFKDNLTKNLIENLLRKIKSDNLIKRDLQKINFTDCNIRGGKNERHKIKGEEIIFKYSKK